MDIDTEFEFDASAPSEIGLTSWRERRPNAFESGCVEQLLTLLLAKTAFDDDAGKTLLTLAAQGETSAMIAVADRIGASGADLTYSWLVLAALHGDNVARVQIAAELARKASVIARKTSCERRRLMALAHEWLTPMVRGFARSFGDDRMRTVQELVDKARAALDASRPVATNAEDFAAIGGPTLVVAKGGVPLMKGDRDDKALVETWRFLAQQMALAPGPPPNILETVLHLEFPWCTEAIDALVGDLKLRRAMGLPWVRFRPTLLVGPPGTAKTSFARRVAELSATGVGELSAAGSADNRLLAGTARGWSTSQPSLVLQVMRQHKVANPVCLVDEIDKTRADGRNGDIRATLLGMLEPTTARSWLDECLCVPVDLSAVSWILTANDIHPLRGPLLTRLRVIEIGLPTEEHAEAIVAGIRRDLARHYGVDEQDLPALPKSADHAILSGLRRGISLRRMHAAYDAALRAGMPGITRRAH